MESFNNFMNTIHKFSNGFNKSIILDYISQNSFDIISQNVNTIKNALESIVTVFEEIRATSESTSNNTSQINHQMAEIIDNNQSLDQGLNKRVAEISNSNEQAKEMLNLFEDINLKSREIKGITGKIQNVSKRTNVLAINASIEASKAGQQGQGFSIIASEVRDLATQTSSFAKDIEKTIGLFNQRIREVHEYVRNFSKVLDNFNTDIVNMKQGFEKNTQSANAVGESISMISHSVQEETLALQEGLEKLENIFDITRNAHIISTSIQKAYKEVDKVLSGKK